VGQQGHTYKRLAVERAAWGRASVEGYGCHSQGIARLTNKEEVAVR